jgi:hypothetical protein
MAGWTSLQGKPMATQGIRGNEQTPICNMKGGGLRDEGTSMC